MKTRPRKYGTNPERTALARQILVDAAIALIADRGPREFIVAEVERLAGLKRGVAAYHFRSGSALLQTALATLVREEVPPAEKGLRPLLSWMQQELAASAAGRPPVRAKIGLIATTGGGVEIRRAQRLYWTSRTAFVEGHLTRAQILEEIRAELDVAGAAEMLVGQLHGEQLRIVTTNAKASPLFAEFIERGLAPEPAKPTPRRAHPAGAQQSLFD